MFSVKWKNLIHHLLRLQVHIFHSKNVKKKEKTYSFVIQDHLFKSEKITEGEQKFKYFTIQLIFPISEIFNTLDDT